MGNLGGPGCGCVFLPVLSLKILKKGQLLISQSGSRRHFYSERIDLPVMAQNFVVQMRPCRPAGRANKSDILTLPHSSPILRVHDSGLDGHKGFKVEL